MSPTTVRLVHRVLTKALSDAVDCRLLAANPAQHAKVPARRRTEMRTWKAEQAAAFLRSAAGDRLYAAWLLALACGLRRGELAGLRWADVDLEQRTLSVVSQRTTDADWQIVTKEPKGTSRRTIDLGGETVAALRAHWRQSLSERPTHVGMDSYRARWVLPTKSWTKLATVVGRTPNIRGSSFMSSGES